MDRRDFLVSTGFTAAAAALPPLVAAAAAPLHPTLPAATATVAARHVLTLAVEGAGGCTPAAMEGAGLARAIEAATGDAVAVRVVPAAEATGGIYRLHAESEVVVRDAGVLVDVDPAFAYLAGLPGRAALTAGETAQFLAEPAVATLLDDLGRRYGIKVLPCGHSGPRYLFSAMPLTSPAAFAGKVVRASGLARNVVTGLGADPWFILPSRTAAQIAAGLPIGIEASVHEAMDLRLLSNVRFAMPLALSPNGSARVLVVARRTWDGLDDGIRAAISRATGEAYEEALAFHARQAPLMARALEETCALDLSPADRRLAATIETISRAVVAEAASANPIAGRMNALYMGVMSGDAMPGIGPAAA